MPISNTQEEYEIRSISPVHINPSIMEGRFLYPSILGPDRAVEIVRYAPVFLVLPLLTGDPGIPSLLTCSAGVVDASPSPSRHYEWFLDGVPAGREGIGPAFSTFQTDNSHDGVEITCLVTATNVLGSAEGLSNGITASVIEDVVVGELYNFGVTGLPADESVTVFQDQIAILTGMWINDFTSVFQTTSFIVSGLGAEDLTTVFDYDIYTATFVELVDTITISNSGAESGIASWTVTDGTLRSVPTSNIPPGGGNYVFMGAPVKDVTTSFNQVRNIHADELPAVAAGNAFATLSLWAAQANNFDDHKFRMRLAFLDASGATISTLDPFGWVEPMNGSSSQNPHEWHFYRTPAEPIPTNATQIRILLDFEAVTNTTGNDCQIDLISLQIHETV